MDQIGTTTSNSPTLEELLDDLRSIYAGSWDAIDRRARVLYEYAKRQEEGIIVELGTYLGYGAFSLAYGALSSGNGLSVYTVDDYLMRTGWAGEVYTPNYRDTFQSNWNSLFYKNQINLHHVSLSAEDASRAMSGVGLLFVDVSPAIDTLKYWNDPVMQGGIILFRDTLTRSLGYDKQVQKAVEPGKWIELETPDKYFLAIKKVA